MGKRGDFAKQGSAIEKKKNYVKNRIFVSVFDRYAKNLDFYVIISRIWVITSVDKKLSTMLAVITSLK